MSERKPGAENQLAASKEEATTSESAGLESEPVEWAKVVLTAQTHSQASVSSPTVRFYRPGTELQVVRREGAWFQPRCSRLCPGAELTASWHG
jgi:hypothetical protein